MEIALRCVLGFLVSLLAGLWVTGRLINSLRKPIVRQVSELKPEERPIDVDQENLTMAAWQVGLVERIFFTVLVSLGISGIAPAMILWITVKMAYNWNILARKRGHRLVRSYMFATLLGNLCSMLFAAIGGSICRGQIWWWPS